MGRRTAGVVIIAGAAAAWPNVAWAAPVVSPGSGPTGTRVAVTDTACAAPAEPMVSLLTRFETTDRFGQVLASGGSPAGGVLTVDGPGTGVLTGPPGTYFLNVECARPSPFGGFPILTGSTSQVVFEMTGPSGGTPALPAVARDGAPQPAVPGASAGEGTRAQVRAAELAQRDLELAERDREIAARATERDAELAQRDVDLAERDREIAARAAERDAEMAQRELELAARNAEADAR